MLFAGSGIGKLVVTRPSSGKRRGRCASGSSRTGLPNGLPDRRIGTRGGDGPLARVTMRLVEGLEQRGMSLTPGRLVGHDAGSEGHGF
jgi:hypothetical protein